MIELDTNPVHCLSCVLINSNEIYSDQVTIMSKLKCPNYDETIFLPFVHNVNLSHYTSYQLAPCVQIFLKPLPFSCNACAHYNMAPPNIQMFLIRATVFCQINEKRYE